LLCLPHSKYFFIAKVFFTSNNVIRICYIDLEKSYQSSQIPEHNFLLLQMTNNRTVHCSNYHILLTYCTTTSVSEIQASHKPRIWTLPRAEFLQNLWLRCPEILNNAMKVAVIVLKNWKIYFKHTIKVLFLLLSFLPHSCIFFYTDF